MQPNKQHCGVTMAAAVQTTLLGMEHPASVTQMPRKDLAVLQMVGAGKQVNLSLEVTRAKYVTFNQTISPQFQAIVQRGTKVILENWAALTRTRSGPSLTRRAASKGVQTSATIERGALVSSTKMGQKNMAPAGPTRAETATLGKN